MSVGNLAVRSLSALILAPMVIIAEWQGGVYFDGLMLLLLGLAFHEWFSICRNQDVVTKPFARFAMLITGGVYIGAACMALAWMRAIHPDGAMLVLMVLLAVWASDTGAYFAGTLIGGPKLAPRISPKKTWAGVIGGLVAAALVGATMAHFGEAHDNALAIASLAGVIGLLTVVGDLLESWVKRRVDIKDSGSLIPGHGGVLDRVDGLLAAAIGVFVIVQTMPFAWDLWP